MTEQYDPYKNAFTERINGILKQEFDIDKFDTNLKSKETNIKQKKGSDIKSLPLDY